MVKVCDVVTINAPLHPQTENMFDDALLSKMKRGSYIVNTARGKICDRDSRSCGPWNAGSSQAMRGMSGFRSRLPRIIPGGACRITA